MEIVRQLSNDSLVLNTKNGSNDISDSLLAIPVFAVMLDSLAWVDYNVGNEARWNTYYLYNINFDWR